MPTLVTRQIQIRHAEGVWIIPSGLRVKPAKSFQLCPREGLYVLVDLPEEIFPLKSSRRKLAESEGLTLNASQLMVKP